METLHYQVAGHSFVIAAPHTGAVSLLLPSYTPFLQAPTPVLSPLFTLELTPEEVTHSAPFYTSFEWDEAWCKVYRNPAVYAFEIHPKDQSGPYLLVTDPAFTEASMQWRPEDPSFSFALGNFLMMMYAFSAAARDMVVMHASVIRYQGKGYLFQGKSGIGKSIHSALWLRHFPEAELLNDDNPVVRLRDGKAYVSGSPWSGKTPCYRNEEIPAGTFVRLYQAPFNQMSRQETVPAFASLLPSCSNMKWDERIHDSICHTVGKLVTCTPVFCLECLPDEAAARLCQETVTGSPSL